MIAHQSTMPYAIAKAVASFDDINSEFNVKRRSLSATTTKQGHRRADSGGRMGRSSSQGSHSRVSLRYTAAVRPADVSNQQHLGELLRLVEENAQLLSPPLTGTIKPTVSTAANGSTSIETMLKYDIPNDKTSQQEPTQIHGSNKTSTFARLYRSQPKLNDKVASEPAVTIDSEKSITTRNAVSSSVSVTSSENNFENADKTTNQPPKVQKTPICANRPRVSHAKKLSDSYIIIQAQKEKNKQFESTDSITQAGHKRNRTMTSAMIVMPPPSHKPLPPPNLPIRPKTEVELSALHDEKYRHLLSSIIRPYSEVNVSQHKKILPLRQPAVSMAEDSTMDAGKLMAAPLFRSHSAVEKTLLSKESSPSVLNEDRRHKLAHLLKIQTQAEALYVRRLQTLRDQFYEPLKRRYGAVRRWITFNANGTGTRTERMNLLARIFGQVVVLLEFHDDFLGKLRTLDKLALATSVRAVVGLFQKRLQGFEADVDYLRKYPAALTTFENLCFHDGRFRKAVKVCETEAGHVNIRAFLGTPKEQLRRYMHFMAKISELCPNDSFDKRDAVECHASLERLLERSASALAQVEDVEEAAKIHMKVTRLPNAVLSAAQKLVYEGAVIYRTSHSSETREYPVQCYLLSDRLVLADKTEDPRVFEHRRTIMLADIRLAPAASDPVTQENLVRLGTAEDSVMLKTADYASFCTWAQLIYDAKALIPSEARVICHKKRIEKRLSDDSMRAFGDLQNPQLDSVRQAIDIPV
ncbi:hypothetical protein BDF19DRAFT_47508 [Syncephalis fuscata]|nr:hypothetical protein BDF19DRAFT_47508 [Syncephalis fuscata]